MKMSDVCLTRISGLSRNGEG